MAAILHRFGQICLSFLVFLSIFTSIAYANVELSAIYDPYTMSSDFYVREAQGSDELRGIDLKLLAAGRLLVEKKYEKARIVLQSFYAKTDRQSTIYQILWAKYYLIQGMTTESLQFLAKAQKLEETDLYYQCEYHELLALAYQAEHQYTQAALQRMKLDILLGEHRSQLINRRQLWQLLQKMSHEEVDTQFLEADEGSEWKAWLALSRIMRHPNAQEELAEWERLYPHHPALSIVKKPRSFFSFFDFSKPVEMKNPHQIALLLPLSGQLSGPGEAIKTGFMQAYQEKNSRVNVRVYDTNQGGALSQYHRAIEEGAGIVVGPLTKPDVQAVGASFSSTPTLLLNDYSGSLSRYKMAVGFSPKDEALQLVYIMSQKSYRRILMITPDSAWGKEIASVFRNEAQKQGMRVVETIQYGQGQNMSHLIQSGLGYSEYKTQAKNGRSQIHGSCRQDIDAIFMLAYPSVARQIMPLLKYYYAGDIPIYSTSASYDAFYNPSQNKDLDGLHFVDIPWVFNHQLGHRPWPEAWNTYSRLYALGYDSFTLTQQWSILQSMPQSGLSKKTGIMYVMPNGHIRRELILGQIHHGVAREEEGMLSHLTH